MSTRPADPLGDLLAADDLDEVEALRSRLTVSDEASETVRALLEAWSDRRALGNLLLCADLVLPPELAVPALVRALSGPEGRGPGERLAVAAAVGAQRLADADLLEEPDRQRLVAALVQTAQARRDAAGARAAYALTVLAEPADAPELLPLADSDVEVVRHNALALLLNLLGVRGLAEQVLRVEGEGVPDRRLGGALQARVALGEAGVDLGAPAEDLLPPGHPLRSYLVSEMPER
ncbi:MAG: hypothetical protein ACTHQ3_21745 [Motilibacteraceae bacterium]